MSNSNKYDLRINSIFNTVDASPYGDGNSYQFLFSDGKRSFECDASILVKTNNYEYCITGDLNSFDISSGIRFKSIAELTAFLNSSEVFDTYSGDPLISTAEKSLLVLIANYMIETVK